MSFMMPTTVLTVTQLNRHIRHWLEHDMGEIEVQGELSNVTVPSSGHAYFTLKDAGAQVRCVYFKSRHKKDDRALLQNGQQVMARGTLSLYEARGDYQLIVQSLAALGQGDLHQQFEALKQKLSAQGLFQAERKKSLPIYPRCIGVITSPSAAALRDILTTLARRYPLASVVIYPSDVQGKRAPQQLCQALQRANEAQRCDVLILARGGGSLEDLWAFNDEALAYAMVASRLPIVTGIGHETDITIADFVADVRAATPTAAAETVTPDATELMLWFRHIEVRLQTRMQRVLEHQRLLLDHAIKKMTSPGRLILTHWQTLDYVERRLYRAQHALVLACRHRLNVLTTQLNANNPQHVLHQRAHLVERLLVALIQGMRKKVQHGQQRLASNAATLHAVSPLATLERGYALATQAGHVITSAKDVKIGSHVSLRLAQGELVCEVERVVL